MINKEQLIKELKKFGEVSHPEKVWCNATIENVLEHAKHWEHDDIPLDWKLKQFKKVADADDECYEVCDGEKIWVMQLFFDNDKVYINYRNMSNTLYYKVQEAWDNLDEYEKHKIRKQAYEIQ